MSVAASIPCIRLPNSSASSSSSPSSSTFRFSQSKSFLTIRSSQTEGPLRRPVSPPLREPLKPQPPPSPSSSPPPLPPKPVATTVAPAVEEDLKGGVTLEYQRQKAKELQKYFKQKKIEETADQGPAFGWLSKNEINNGRWAMFGFAVGLLTEYATGSNFVVQMKILLSNFGIVDLE
ncbi:hypothetical protein V2J09_001467 [Rumex salicifolius]